MRADLGRALDQARVALAATDDVGLTDALRRVEELGAQLRLAQPRSIGTDG